MKPIRNNRRNIKQRSPANDRFSPEWKDEFKKKCLERARQQRSKNIAKRRESSFSSPSTPMTNTASLIQEQLKVSGTTVVSNNFGYTTPVKYSYPTAQNWNKAQSMTDDTDAVDYITEEELFTLMQEVEEDLKRDEEQYYAEQMELIHQEELANQHLVEDQIASFEETTNQSIQQCISCPLCHRESLFMDNNGKVYCQQTSNQVGNASCKLANRIELEEVSDLDGLRNKLGMAFQEHSTFCQGILQFDIVDIDGTFGMYTGCATCRKRGLIARAKAN
ncbi:hypothetical protein CTEN210_02641 [Chaetoceros tenuissimus]|uniref:RPA-interacting protein C-terminal domain-containing protein n=1 Tax=Chaetoceros tenuissimus TaxID=426638 RepID=A0AAD3CHE5_9STRA|nr:hypothetical protein CTEN210_02641 [Chaetoceros tenuissimus]